MLLSVQLSAERMSQDHHTPFNISCWLHLKDETVFSPLKKKKKTFIKIYIFVPWPWNYSKSKYDSRKRFLVDSPCVFDLIHSKQQGSSSHSYVVI